MHRYANSFAKVWPSIELNHEGIVIYEGPGTIPLTQEYNIPVNDGKWHQVSILFNNVDGVKLVVDSLSRQNRIRAWIGEVFDVK